MCNCNACDLSLLEMRTLLEFKKSQGTCDGSADQHCDTTDSNHCSICKSGKQSPHDKIDVSHIEMLLATDLILCQTSSGANASINLHAHSISIHVRNKFNRATSNVEQLY